MMCVFFYIVFKNLFCLFKNIKYAFVLGFEVGYQYEYDLESRTLTSLQQPSANQYTGVVIRAKVLIRGISQNAVTLQVQITDSVSQSLESHYKNLSLIEK